MKRYTPDEYGIPQPTRPRVRDWPVYLLRQIPAGLRENLAAEAETRDLSVADVIREILCHHYRLDCPPRGYGYNGVKEGTDTMVLRLQPELWREIQADKKISGSPVRTLVIDTLRKRYEEETP